MSKAKGKIKSVKKILLYAVLPVVVLAVSLAGSFSLARYISSGGLDDSANVANLGIEIYKLSDRQELVEKIDFTQVVPGADIPAPHIQLKLKSEVSYTLFIKVTTTGFSQWETDTQDKTKIIGAKVMGEDHNDNEREWVKYTLGERWDYVTSSYDDKTNVRTSTYKYNLATDVKNDTADYVFKPTVQYDFTDKNELQILKGDVIYISQYYDHEKAEKFTLTFETYIHQVLTPQ